METASTCIMNGLVTSAMYILVSLGFALLLSIMGIFNFAHGAIYMVGGFVTYGFSVALGINPWASFVLSIIVMGLFGLFLEKFCFRPFMGNANSMMIMSIALIFILETGANIWLGGWTRALPSFIPGVLKAGFFSVTWERFLTLIIGAVLLVLMTLLINKTTIGQQMLAVAQDKTGAALQGININRTAAFATALACMMACVAGTLMAALLSLNPYMGDSILNKAIEVVILSGIGSIGGVFFGGLIIGFLNAVLPVFISSALSETIVLVIIMVILLIRPKGLFGYELF